MKGLVLAGGHGTRLRPITYTSNKHLIPLANKPMLYYPIKTLTDAGITEIGIIVGHTPQRIHEIKEAVGDGSKFGVKVTYIEQDAPRGLAHAVKTAKEFLTTNNDDGKFVVHLGDNILKSGIKKYIENFRSENADCVVLLKSVPEPSRFGVAEIKDGKLVKVIEKPKVPPSNLALVGVYMFNKSVFEFIESLSPSPRNEYEITDAIQCLIDSGKKVIYHIINSDWWKDPGDPHGILEVNRLLLNDITSFNHGAVEDGAVVVGKVCIEDGSAIRNGCSIIGPVIIGRNCTIENNARIGPYTSIGDNTIVKNAYIESTIIIGDSKIDCNQKITDSLIGRNVTISSAKENAVGICQLVIGENSFVKL